MDGKLTDDEEGDSRNSGTVGVKVSVVRYHRHMISEYQYA